MRPRLPPLLLPLRVAVAGHTVVVALAVGRHVAADVSGQRAFRVGLLPADQRHHQALRRRGVVPAVTALHAQPPLRAGLLPALRVRDRALLPVHIVSEGAAHAAVRADGVHRVQLGARPDRDVVDRLVRQRAGRACGHALAAGHARRGAHRVAQVERDTGVVALAAAPDHVVALDVVAGPHAAVAQDAGVVVDGDHRAGQVGAATRRRGQGGAVRGEPEPFGQREQFVVAGRRLLRVALAWRLVADQQLRQHRAAALKFRRACLNLHPVLAGPHAGGGERGRAHVDYAHPADAHRIETLVVAQHRDINAGGPGGLPDSGALRGGDLTSVNRERYRCRAFRGGDGHSGSIRLPSRARPSPGPPAIPGSGRPSGSSPRLA